MVITKKYDYVIFSPYFGKLPIYFQEWLNSCAYNKDFKFIVFTDDKTSFDVPDNVVIENISYDCFFNKLCSKLNIYSKCKRSYKLCDFKPTYGYTLSDYLGGCLFWGHCDLDLIFGNLKKFLPDNLPDKLSKLGHFCLYRNCREVNEAFMIKTKKAKFGYREILSSSINFAFDEIGEYGINRIFEENGMTVGDYNITCADISSIRECLAISRFGDGLFRIDENSRVFKFERGKISSFEIDADGKLNEIEYSYVHLQKRKMCYQENLGDTFLITYNSFEKNTIIDLNFIRKKQPKHKRNKIKNLSIRIKNIKNRILLFFEKKRLGVKNGNC